MVENHANWMSGPHSTLTNHVINAAQPWLRSTIDSQTDTGEWPLRYPAPLHPGCSAILTVKRVCISCP